MKISNIFIVLVFVFSSLHLMAQEAQEVENDSIPKAEKVWKMGGGLGFDFAQLLQVNPKPGAGNNRLGIGGLGNWFVNYNKDNISWENNISLQLSAQKLGAADSLFLKNLDVFRFNSKFGFKGNREKLYIAAELQSQTLLLNTYEDNVLRNRDGNRGIIAKFMSPLTLSFSPGLDYKPNEQFSFFYSPISYKLIYVQDNEIAALNIHGNIDGENSLQQMGSNFKMVYTSKFMEDKMSLITSLDLFSNYLNKPQNIDILWKSDLNIELFKNISLNLVTELFYDDDIKVILDSTGDTGVALSFTEALLIKYNVIF